MSKLYSILICLFATVGVCAQPYETNPDFNRTRNWHFGNGIGLHFTPDTVIVSNSAIITPEAAAVHSDADGNLLLYSNGEKIWNANHEVIHNGNLALGSNNSSMGSIFVIHENNPNLVYLFNTNFSGSVNKELSFNLIIREADTFRVVFKDSVLQTGMSEPIAVVKADNGKDIWILTHVFNGSAFIVYRLNEEGGIISCPIQLNSNSYTGNTTQSAQFDIKFSPNGKYVIKSNRNILNDRGAELYQFNSHNGNLSYLFSIDGLYLVTGIAFSKNNENVFVIERDSFLNVYSFNALDSSTTINSRKKIFIPDLKFEIQNLTYSDDLVLSLYDSLHLALITNPNSYDFIDLSIKGISLGGSRGSNGLPNFNQSYFYTPSINFTYQLNCITNIIQFYGQDTFNANTHSWKIAKQGSNTITANTKAPLIEFADTGVYQVRYIASNGTRSDTLTKEVVIFPKINKDFLGSDTGWCNSVGIPIDINAPSGMHCYEWNTGETTRQITADTIGVYIAKITSPNFCVLYDTLVVSVDTTETIETEDNFLGSDKSWCENIDTVVTLSAPSGFDNYLWSNGLTSRKIEVKEAGIYWVRVSNRNQCESDGNLYTYDTLEITSLIAPPKPILNRTGNSLFVNLSDDYVFRWYFNNLPVMDTLSYIIISDTGYYHVAVRNQNDCQSISDTIHIATLGINNHLFSQIRLFSNPTNGIITIELFDSYDYTYNVSSLNGKVISKGGLNYGTNSIDISYLSDGMYYIAIYCNNKTATYKLIKQTE